MIKRKWFIGFSLSLVLLVSCQVAPATTLPPPTPTQPATPTPAEPICFTPADILPFAFTPDSQSILVRGMAGVQIFDLNALKEASFLQAPQNIVTAALSPDGKTLAWSLDDNTIQLIRVSDQAVLQTLSGHTDMVTKLRFTPDGQELVSASHDFSVRVWDMEGKELRSFQPPGEVLGIGISPDGSMLATVPFEGPVSLWKLDTLEKIKDLGGAGSFDTSDAEFSADGQYLAADLASGLYLWRIADGEQIWDDLKNSMAVDFSPDGRYMAYSDIEDSVKVYLATQDGSKVVRFMEGHQSPVWEMFFSPDSQLLLSTDGMDIRIWNVEDGSLRFVGRAVCP
jgi:WD40 repeat protein